MAVEAQEVDRAVRVALGADLDLEAEAGQAVALGVVAAQVAQEACQVLALVRVAVLVAALMAVGAQALGVDQVLGVDPMALMDPMDQEAVALGAVPVAVLGVGVDLAALVLMEVGVDRVVALGLMAVDQVLGAGPVSPASAKVLANGSGSRLLKNG